MKASDSQEGLTDAACLHVWKNFDRPHMSYGGGEAINNLIDYEGSQ